MAWLTHHHCVVLINDKETINCNAEVTSIELRDSDAMVAHLSQLSRSQNQILDNNWNQKYVFHVQPG